jgi:hypothetical protein
MREHSLTEAVTLFWRKDMEELKFRPEDRYFEHAQDAIVWAFEALSKDQRWSAYLLYQKDHEKVRISDLEATYRSIKSN